MINGYFSIVLHAHMPYVRHDDPKKLEQRWIFEAISETYIPLLWTIANQNQKNVLTISFSAPLMEMLTDPLIQKRYLQYLDKSEALLNKESASVISVAETQLVNFYRERVKKIRDTFLLWDRNLLNGFRFYDEAKIISCICSSASHAFLPYLHTKEAINAQIIHGIDVFKKNFGKKPLGFWLPECGYTSTIDEILSMHHIKYTFIDRQTLGSVHNNYYEKVDEPGISPNGIVLFPRNKELSNQVWNSSNGYPGDFDYREYYRDIAYMRDWDYIKEFIYPIEVRVNTGLKYYRVTGATEEKQLYIRNNALNKVREHSEHFCSYVQEKMQRSNKGILPKVIVTAFDAELFGHWWFEGPEWLDEVILVMSDDNHFISFEDYINEYYHCLLNTEVSFSSWGRNGYGEVWLNEKNDWIYRELHELENELIICISKFHGKSLISDRFLKQMVREWMLAASSDWAFIIDAGSSVTYANDRLNEHFFRFRNLKEMLCTEQLNERNLSNYENEYPFLKNVRLEVFNSNLDEYVLNKKKELIYLANKTILMLAWEFPPLIVGGLSRHVYDLSRALVKQGYNVHVITTATATSRKVETIDGVFVYRINSLQPNIGDFYHWVGSLNNVFLDCALHLSKNIKFDIIHAHDWLVASSAMVLKNQLNVPLVTTIHATEHGRNNGIFTNLQKLISKKEADLCNVSNVVIVCSHYMKNEVVKLFQFPTEKINVIPNGVSDEIICVANENWKENYGKETDLYIFSIGRIVKEKGFQTIIDAAPSIFKKYPQVKFIIAGKGPMLQYFQEQIKEKGLQNSIFFVGFINDQLRNQMLKECDICLFPSYYEPFGIVALEGMIAGKPTIVTETGGLSEIVTHKETGIKIQPNDAQSLTNAVINCIEDKKLANKIAMNGKKLVETKFSWKTVATNTAYVYDNC